MYSIGIILKEIKSYFNIPQEIANLLQSLNVGCMFLSGPLISGLVSQFGCRKVIIISSIIHSSMYILSPFLPSFYLMLVSYGVIGGLSYGCAFLTGFIPIVDYFDSKLGTANGLAAAASGMGSFVFAPLCNYLISRFGWKIAMIVFGLANFLCVISGGFLRPIDYYRKKFEIEMETLKGLKEDEMIKKESVFKKFIKEVSDFSLLKKNKIFLLIVLSNFFVFFAYYIPFIYIPIRAQQLGITQFAWIISTMGILNIPMRILFGFLCDKKLIAPISMNTICLFLAMISLFSYYFLISFPLQIGFAFVFSIPMAGINCLATQYIVEAVGANSFRNANGIANLLRGLGASSGPFIAGKYFF